MAAEHAAEMTSPDRNHLFNENLSRPGTNQQSPGSIIAGMPENSRRGSTSKPGTPAAPSSSFDCPPRPHPMGPGIVPPTPIPEMFDTANDNYRRNSYKNSFYLKSHTTRQGNAQGGSELVSINSDDGHKQEETHIEMADEMISPNNTGNSSQDSEYTLFFRDGIRRIDLVLVYEEEYQGVPTEQDILKAEKRRVFQENLIKEGLDLEIEECQYSFDEKTAFVKIHIPWKAINRYAEVMNMKKPIKVNKALLRVNSADSLAVNTNFMEMEHMNEKNKRSWFPFRVQKFFELDPKRISSEPSFYMATMSRDREEQFVLKDREVYYTPAQRSQIVWQVLMRASYDNNGKVGIRRLLNNGTYVAAFPIHEGHYIHDNPETKPTDRQLLYAEWARPGRFYKKQPLWLVRKYFGDKIALYFAWLGFYTKMLIPAAIVGLLCFLYGVMTMSSEENQPREICDKNGPGNITMCPLCDEVCEYRKLLDSCTFAKITYLFDNPATVFFAIFMSFWATTFLELWKRRQTVIVWEWDLEDAEEDEEPRPEFEASVKTFRVNPVTREKEPYMPTWSKILRFAATGSMVLFMVFVVAGAVLGTIIYRIAVVSLIYGSGDMFLQKYAKIFTSITAALINLIIIMILTKFYQRLAIWLTNLENPRTQTEYEDNYTFKIFIFQFVNFYSSLIYIAFFKGRFFVHPGDKEARKSSFLKIKIDVCDPAGCLSELCIQLAIIMVGKQFFNNILEILYPKFWNWWYHRIHRNNTKDLKKKLKSWEKDYQMQDGGRLALFEEYLEMVLQYGFVTLFVAAFPLAPLFALLNNIGEIRLDAYKMVTQARRPLAERVEDIGAWYGVLQGLTYASVVSNAFVIAYTSDYIPRQVYKFTNVNNTLVGYIDASLSEFNTSDYEDFTSNIKNPPPICQYRGYRNPSSDKYRLSPQYWHVFAARLAFVVVFEHIVFALTGIMAYAIPDVPREVRTQIQREKMLAKEAKYETGLRTQAASQADLLTSLRDAVGAATGGPTASRSWWSRRLSKVSDSEDNAPKRNPSHVWKMS